MTPAALGKEASTALVRMIQAGKLGPATIQRAAQAFAPGKFRFLQNLGRGQFSLADKVVGNLGGTAGEMVRKLPTRLGATPVEEYGPLQKLITALNEKFPVAPHPALPTTPVGPAIAPFTHVGPQGGFQQLATARVPKIPHDLRI